MIPVVPDSIFVRIHNSKQNLKIDWGGRLNPLILCLSPLTIWVRQYFRDILEPTTYWCRLSSLFWLILALFNTFLLQSYTYTVSTTVNFRNNLISLVTAGHHITQFTLPTDNTWTCTLNLLAFLLLICMSMHIPACVIFPNYNNFCLNGFMRTTWTRESESDKRASCLLWISMDM